jgi:putative transposase
MSRPRWSGCAFERGLPQRIYCDNGTEFVSAAMDLWAYTNGVILDFSRRGKPTDKRPPRSNPSTFGSGRSV